ncbi:hypothetical protein N7530_012034 [Penicillium desertorum]|uniref:Uncharacterized protein n=1 Tax=Penicillium desertorum TaxID=1303715 RepID=A0A9W9WEL6_9EURO|nr:hypothetical protein N7530_012034 [Penicillium desertorum]
MSCPSWTEAAASASYKGSMVARAQSYQDDKISAALGHKRITSCVLESWNEADTAGTVDDEEKKNHA